MIRQANPQDAPQIAPLIILAMGPLATKFANSDDPEKQLSLFERFVGMDGNQYSYHNILVYEGKGKVCGMIIGYDGARLDELRAPFLLYITNELGFTGKPEDETQAGELYIDCLAVALGHQGKGIGKKLIESMLRHATALGHSTVGLLVSKGNAGAQKLYTGLGFEHRGEVALLGGYHYHLQYTAKPAR